MDRSLLEKVICPTFIDGARCGGRLSLREDEVAPSFRAGDPGELLEGALGCGSCGMRYPVMLGVPILLDGVRNFLRYGIKLLSGFIEQHGGTSAAMRKFINNEILKALKRKDEPVAPISTEYKGMTADGMQKYIAVYLDSHFGDPAKSAGNDVTRRLNEVLHKKKNPVHVLVDMAQRHLHVKKPRCLDLGCSVGGLTSRMAPLCGEIYGVDLSFEKIFYARGIVKHAPKKISAFPLYREGSYYDEMPLNVEKLVRGEFLVASGENLPFEDAFFDMISHANLVDIINDPLKLISEQERLLREGGLCLLSTPFLYNSATVVNFFAVHGRQPVEALKALLAPAFDFLEEADDLPWLMRHASRKYELLFDYCLAARKRLRNT
jgi:SAM-dependent methyltransferase/uncharacterized protein YbaR (Trm112 family)